MFHFRRALADVRANKFLHALAVTTICLIFLLAGSFALVFVNVTQLVRSQHERVRVMAYLAPGAGEADVARIGKAASAVPGVHTVTFISREEALETLRADLGGQAGLLEDIGENPLPDGFEILVDTGAGEQAGVDNVAARLRSIPGVAEVNYAGAWLDRFALFIEFSRMIGVALACLLVVASVSITSNTVRLVLYNRREEIQIMQLVGATDSFIRAPLYIEAVLQALVGGLLALGLLAAGYQAVVSGVNPGVMLGRFEPRFLPAVVCVAGLLLAALVGWIGCYVSFRQIVRV